MKTLRPEEIAELRKRHRQLQGRRDADRVKAVILLGTGWTMEKVCEALLLHEDSLREYCKRFEKGGVEALLENHYQGKQYRINAEQLAMLEEQLQSQVYKSSKEIIAWLDEKGINYSRSGIIQLLHAQGYEYCLAKVQPNVGSEAAQRDFIEQYQALKQEAAAEIFFMDGVHPQHNTNVSYGWYKANQKKVFPANTSRKRLNINAVLNPNTLELVYRSEESINAEVTIQLLQDLEKQVPHKKIYVICDNARYYRAKIVTEYLTRSRIKLVFLPAYCPHLNLIERLWRFLKQGILSNRYRQRFIEFKQSCFDFLDNLNDYASGLRTLLVDNFNISVPPLPKS